MKQRQLDAARRRTERELHKADKRLQIGAQGRSFVNLILAFRHARIISAGSSIHEMPH
jgi:transposase